VSKLIELSSLLMDIEVELRALGCWDGAAPSENALQSVEPFSVDTMEFYQWLQWIFIPRLSQMIKDNSALPVKCEIAAMGEVWAASRGFQDRELLSVLKAMDILLTEN